MQISGPPAFAAMSVQRSRVTVRSMSSPAPAATLSCASRYSGPRSSSRVALPSAHAQVGAKGRPAGTVDNAAVADQQIELRATGAPGQQRNPGPVGSARRDERGSRARQTIDAAGLIVSPGFIEPVACSPSGCPTEQRTVCCKLSFGDNEIASSVNFHPVRRICCWCAGGAEKAPGYHGESYRPRSKRGRLLARSRGRPSTCARDSG